MEVVKQVGELSSDPAGSSVGRGALWMLCCTGTPEFQLVRIEFLIDGGAAVPAPGLRNPTPGSQRDRVIIMAPLAGWLLGS